VIALLLDLANIFGGFLLAIPLLAQIPRIGDDLVRADRTLAPFAWIVGVVALVAGGYYLIVHLTDGPHVFHFELIGIAVGVALLWNRLRRPSGLGDGVRGSSTTDRGLFEERHDSGPRAGTATPLQVEGTALLLAIFGLIAILVGLQGLFTPD
jgi:hypothetical protein